MKVRLVGQCAKKINGVVAICVIADLTDGRAKIKERKLDRIKSGVAARFFKDVETKILLASSQTHGAIAFLTIDYATEQSLPPDLQLAVGEAVMTDLGLPVNHEAVMKMQLTFKEAA